jgi:hypothetical protein
MAKLLQDIWILKKDGTTLFNRVYKEKMNAQLFGGFMSALNAFSSQIDEGGLHNFEIGDKRFIMSKRDDLMFVASFDKKVKAKRASSELERIMKKFLMKYTVELVAWDGNTSTFEDFKDEIKDSLDDVIDNFEKAFW